MTIPEVLDVFEGYTKEENIPFRFIDLQHMCLVSVEAVKEAYRPTIESIEEADIERHTSYANQRREDVIRMMVQSVIKYATLSHTRLPSAPEFKHHDMMSNAPRTGAGWDKLKRFCDLARGSFNCRFAWADAVCIDCTKQRDQQLGPQSLFNWYRNAYICIAYLSSASDSSDMAHDEWFYSGFTLTELLAPMRMKFYGTGWKALNNNDIDNDKADTGFLELVSKASGVPVDDLRTFWPGPDRIRQKLSWASGRKTSAVEDQAYSLMAMFDSRIPVSYGEGKKAFTRLMVDVIPKSGECDAFAWAGPHSSDHPGIPPSPEGFGEERHDQQLNQTPHHYRLCGDRSLSMDLDHIRLRVIVLQIGLPSKKVTSYIPTPLRHAASISKVTLLHPSDMVLRVRGSVQMAVGVVDYNWTNNPDEGVLHKDAQYFCFLLYRTPETGRWGKLLTEKVVFLTNEQRLVQKLDTLDMRSK